MLRRAQRTVWFNVQRNGARCAGAVHAAQASLPRSPAWPCLTPSRAHGRRTRLIAPASSWRTNRCGRLRLCCTSGRRRCPSYSSSSSRLGDVPWASVLAASATCCQTREHAVHGLRVGGWVGFGRTRQCCAPEPLGVAEDLDAAHRSGSGKEARIPVVTLHAVVDRRATAMRSAMRVLHPRLRLQSLPRLDDRGQGQPGGVAGQQHGLPCLHDAVSTNTRPCCLVCGASPTRRRRLSLPDRVER